MKYIHDLIMKIILDTVIHILFVLFHLTANPHQSQNLKYILKILFVNNQVQNIHYFTDLKLLHLQNLYAKIQAFN